VLAVHRVGEEFFDLVWYVFVAGVAVAGGEEDVWVGGV